MLFECFVMWALKSASMMMDYGSDDKVSSELGNFVFVNSNKKYNGIANDNNINS